SGSKGNCLYIENNGSAIFVDCGLSGKATESALSMRGLSIDNIEGIIVTHEHIDHTSGIGVMARKYKKKIYITKKTFSALPSSVGVIPEDKVCFINDNEFEIGEFKVTPFKISHDAIDPKGYTIQCDNKKVCIATDTGVVTPEMSSLAKGCDFMFLESNHDVFMLTHGTYPIELQRRILSDFGHLPNKEAASFAVWLASKGTERFMLGHLSGENNTEELAHTETYRALKMAGFLKAAETLTVASRYFPSDLIEL
ncbi:MAG: MBL fold metallo-hydrolase, partial [Clostridia bacterium]|nr:MBL fold metallo-hydrolase [Clostridia bacterium]